MVAYPTENFLKDMLSPLLKDCQYLIDSPKQFKNKFLPLITQFTHETHVVVSFDAVKLFHNVDVVRTVNFVMKEIFTKPREFFKDKDKDGNLLPIPSRPNFRKFLIAVLTEFNLVKSQIGNYKQFQGLAMSSLLVHFFLT